MAAAAGARCWQQCCEHVNAAGKGARVRLPRRTYVSWRWCAAGGAPALPRRLELLRPPLRWGGAGTCGAMSDSDSDLPPALYVSQRAQVPAPPAAPPPRAAPPPPRPAPQAEAIDLTLSDSEDHARPPPRAHAAAPRAHDDVAWRAPAAERAVRSGEAAAPHGFTARPQGGNAAAPPQQSRPRAHAAVDEAVVLSDEDDEDLELPLALRLAQSGCATSPAGAGAAAPARRRQRAPLLGGDDSGAEDDEDWCLATTAGRGGGGQPARKVARTARDDAGGAGGGDAFMRWALGDSGDDPPPPPAYDSGDDYLPVLATKRAAAKAPARSGGAGAATAADKARRAEERREAAAAKKAEKEAQKANKAAAREEHRAATGKLANQQISVFIDSRLASSSVGRALGAALEAAKFAHSVATLPVEGSVCWVRHAARTGAWAGALPWPAAAAAAAAARDGATAVPYVMLVMDAPRLTAAVQAHGGLEHLVPLVRAAHPGATLCVCGVGVAHYLRARERSEFSTANPTAGFSRKEVDAALMRLVTHVRGVRQRLAKDEAQAAEHGALLTEALAKQPFRAEESFLSLFGGEKKGAKPAVAAPASQPADDDDGGAGAGPSSGNKRSAEHTLADAWVAALARVPGSSPDSAVAIARVYPSMAALMAAYRAPGLTESAAKGLLANLTREAAVPGAKTRRVGPVCSERMWKLLRARPAGDAGLEELVTGGTDKTAQ